MAEVVVMLMFDVDIEGEEFAKSLQQVVTNIISASLRNDSVANSRIKLKASSLGKVFPSADIKIS